MPQEAPIVGHLLRASAAGFTVGTRAEALEALNQPLLGCLCQVEAQGQTIYGLIADIRVLDDGLVQQLVAEGRMGSETLADNRYNRNQPVEISVITLGFAQDGRMRPRLPGTPPLALQALRLCTPEEGLRFCEENKFAYLRRILNQTEYPAQEMILAHADQLQSWQPAGNKAGSWYPSLAEALIRALRNDYERLSLLLDALSALEESWK